jgi:hypothetical protein
MALTYIATDELQLAGQWLLEARGRCVRETDTYAALLVTIVADQMKLSLRVGQAKQAEDFARELIRLATRSHMNGYVSLAQNFVRR